VLKLKQKYSYNFLILYATPEQVIPYFKNTNTTKNKNIEQKVGIEVSWVTILFRSGGTFQHFGGTYSLYIQGLNFKNYRS
jgi:hypothetical protein